MKKAKHVPAFNFVLRDKVTGKFPIADLSAKRLVDSVEFTHLFDDRDNQEQKVKYYNIVYKGIAEFEIFKF